MFIRLMCIAAIAAVTAGCTGQSKKARWEPIGLSGGGGLTNPAFSPHDPKTMMTESDMGGRYISHDGGRTWSMIHRDQITSYFRGSPPVFHPNKVGVIYAVCPGTALRVSRDNGKTWQALDDTRQPHKDAITRIYIDPVTDRMLIGTQVGVVMFTDDEGGHWTQAAGTAGRAMKFVAVHDSPKDRRTYLVGTDAGVFKSTDGGRTFVRKTAGLPEGKPITGFAGGSNGKVTMLYAALPCWMEEGKLAGGVYVSKDAGESWQPMMNPRINVQTQRASKWAAGDLPQYRFFVANDVDPKTAYVQCAGDEFLPAEPQHDLQDDGRRGELDRRVFRRPAVQGAQRRLRLADAVPEAEPRRQPDRHGDQPG